MARKLVVEVVGDASSLNRTFKQSERSAKHFGQEMSKVTRGAAAGSGVFRGLGRSLAFASGGFLAVASVSSFLRDSVNAARDAAVAQRSLGAQMKANNESFKDNAQLVEKVSLSYGKFGFQNDEVIASLTVLDRATGNINKSIRLQGVTAAIARVKNIDLAAAAAVVGKVFGGQETALRRAVPGLSKTAHGMDLIREAQRKLAGQAAANTTAAERFQAILHNTEEIIGTALLPTLNKYLNRLGEWLQKMDESGKLQRDVKKATDLIATAFDIAKAALTPLVKAFQLLAKVVGSNTEAIKLLVAAYATFKTAQIAGGLAGMAASMGLLAESTTAASITMKAGLAGAAVLAGYELSRLIRKIPEWDSAMKGLGGAAFDAASKIGLVGDKTKQLNKGLLNPKQVKDLREQLFILENVQDMTHAGAISHLAARHPRLSRHDIEIVTRADPGAPAGALGPLTAASIAARNRAGRLSNAVFDARIDRRLSRSGYDGLRSQLSTLEKVATLIERRIQVTKNVNRKLDLEDKLLQISAQARDIRKQLAQQFVDRLQFRVDVAATTTGLQDDLAALDKLRDHLVKRIKAEKDNLDLRRQLLDVQQQITDVLKRQQEQRVAARSARQFGILGFGPGGEDLVPGVKNLKRQLTSVTDAIEGTFLDTAKTRNRLNNIRRVLAAGVGHISNDVRSKIQQMIADLKAQLRKSSVDVTRFQKTARGQFTLAGAHGAGTGTVVIGNVHLHGIQNVHDLEVALAKRKKQRAHARGGTR